jgi:hypothetical protein
MVTEIRVTLERVGFQRPLQDGYHYWAYNYYGTGPKFISVDIASHVEFDKMVLPQWDKEFLYTSSVRWETQGDPLRPINVEESWFRK